MDLNPFKKKSNYPQEFPKVYYGHDDLSPPTVRSRNITDGRFRKKRSDYLD